MQCLTYLHRSIAMLPVLVDMFFVSSSLNLLMKSREPQQRCQIRIMPERTFITCNTNSSMHFIVNPVPILGIADLLTNINHFISISNGSTLHLYDFICMHV